MGGFADLVDSDRVQPVGAFLGGDFEPAYRTRPGTHGDTNSAQTLFKISTGFGMGCFGQNMSRNKAIAFFEIES